MSGVRTFSGADSIKSGLSRLSVNQKGVSGHISAIKWYKHYKKKTKIVNNDNKKNVKSKPFS